MSTNLHMVASETSNHAAKHLTNLKVSVKDGLNITEGCQCLNMSMHSMAACMQCDFSYMINEETTMHECG